MFPKKIVTNDYRVQCKERFCFHTERKAYYYNIIKDAMGLVGPEELNLMELFEFLAFRIVNS